MTTIKSLNDIEIYRESLLLARDIYRLSKESVLNREFSLVDQIKRAAVSVPANIAEGYGRNTKKDFSQFLSIALGSVNEVITFLDLILQVFKLDTSVLKDKYSILSKRIHSFRSYLLRLS